MQVIKRDGRRTTFSKEKILNALIKTSKETNEISNEIILKIAGEVENHILNLSNKKTITVEEIQDIVERFLKENKYTESSIAYHNYRKELITLGTIKSNLNELAENKLRQRIHQSMQGVVYNLNTMHSRAGSQVPFSSVNIGLPENEDAALVCEIFLEEYEKGLGKGEQPIFPNIIFRVKEGVNREKNDPYFYLYELECRVAAKRMNPTFINIDSDFNKLYYDQGYMPATMGCRTYLMSNINRELGVEGRGNIAPATINLPRVGTLAKGSEEKFFEILTNRLDLAKESLLHRYNVLKNLKVKDLPFVAGQGLMKGAEGLDPDDTIEPILKQGTWGIGFIGLAETLIALTGKHHG